jgi:hypothetical protein
MIVDGTTIFSKPNERSMNFGRLEISTLAHLREAADTNKWHSTGISISEVVDDVQTLHSSPHAEGALFQVASQFNLLEMVSPSVTPEAGVSSYANDPTQGPACAIAAGAGTIFRNYFAPVGGQIGQTSSNQIDCLARMGIVLGNENDRLWSMQNGYSLATSEGLEDINKRLAAMDDCQRDNIRRALRIGLQWDTEVTLDGCGHLVTQAFCSALPVAYSSHLPELWEQFARLILDATYEATLAAASINLRNTGNNKVFLTLVGGGAFGNRIEWILSAIDRALRIFEKCPLDVQVVSYGGPNSRLKELF